MNIGSFYLPMRVKIKTLTDRATKVVDLGFKYLTASHLGPK